MNGRFLCSARRPACSQLVWVPVSVPMARMLPSAGIDMDACRSRTMLK